MSLDELNGAFDLWVRQVYHQRVHSGTGITLDGNLFEAPVKLIGQRVDLLYHKDSPNSVEVRWKQKSYGYITPVDLNVNCRVKRDKNNQAQISSEGNKPTGGKIW